MTNKEIKETKEEIIEQVRAVWESQPESFPAFLQENPSIFPVVDARQKRENEALVQAFFQQEQKKFRQRPEDENALLEWEKNLEQDFREFLGREKIICAAQAMGRELLEEFIRETKRFIERVRDFDRTLSQAQIWQALRNYLIFAVIVDMQGEVQNAGDQILAYSLLYPYTDNYIDDAGVSGECKERYNRMIADKLQGGYVAAQNPLEEKTCLLLDMILGACSDRFAEEKIAGGLLQLLYAQSCSIGQQHMTTAQILETSIWKGSTSVVADYLFSTRYWTREEENFYRKFGFLLQLIDDLQDMEEDGNSGSRTLMTQCAARQDRERCVNRLLWYSWNVIRGFEPVNPGLREFVLKNCVAIILATVGMNGPYFSKAYLEELEPYMSFSIDFLKKMAKRQKKSIV